MQTGVNGMEVKLTGQIDLAGFRAEARDLLAHQVPPESVDWFLLPLPSESFGDQAAGVIVNAAPAPDGGYDALVVAQIESLGRDDLRWKSPQGPALKILSRPQADAAS